MAELMSTITKIIICIALISFVAFFIIERNSKKEQKSKHEVKKILSENMKFMIFGNHDSLNIALGKDSCVYFLDSNNITVYKFKIEEIDDINIHYHIRASKDNNVVSPSLTLNNQTFIDKLDLKLISKEKEYFISYVPYMKHADSNEVRSKIIQMKRFILMIEREKNSDSVVNH